MGLPKWFPSPEWSQSKLQKLSSTQLPQLKLENRLSTNKLRKLTMLQLRKSATTTQVYLIKEEVTKLELKKESLELSELLILFQLTHLVLMVVFMEVHIQEPMVVLTEALMVALMELLTDIQQMLTDLHLDSNGMANYSDQDTLHPIEECICKVHQLMFQLMLQSMLMKRKIEKIEFFKKFVLLLIQSFKYVNTLCKLWIHNFNFNNV